MSNGTRSIIRLNQRHAAWTNTVLTCYLTTAEKWTFKFPVSQQTWNEFFDAVASLCTDQCNVLRRDAVLLTQIHDRLLDTVEVPRPVTRKQVDLVSNNVRRAMFIHKF